MHLALKVWAGQVFLIIEHNTCCVEAPDDWWALWDSNPRPSGYEPGALTTELRALIVKTGIPEKVCAEGFV